MSFFPTHRQRFQLFQFLCFPLINLSKTSVLWFETVLNFSWAYEKLIRLFFVLYIYSFTSDHISRYLRRLSLKKISFSISLIIVNSQLRLNAFVIFSPRGQAWPWVRCLPLITCFFIYRKETGYIVMADCFVYSEFFSVEIIFWITATHHIAESLLSALSDVISRGRPCKI